MTLLQYIFGAPLTQASQQPCILTQEDDIVYPVHFLDDAGNLEAFITTETMCFNDILDKDKIHRSLVQLLEIGDWRKVGGRLRQKTKGKGQLEIYVPRTFTVERPAVSFTSQTYDIAMEDHPLGGRIPKPSGKPYLYPAPEEFRAFAAPPDAPETLAQYLARDIPMLSLHITSFTNSTLVGLAWPHTLMDVMGLQALIRAWSLVLAGRASEVPPMLGAREDEMVAAADNSEDEQEEYVLKRHIMKTWALVKVVKNFAWDIFWYRTIETRTIFLPKTAIADLRLQAQMELVAEKGEIEKPFISEGDVLTAWTMRAVASALPQPRPITAVHAINARFRLRPLIDAPGVFVQNMVVAGFTFVEHSVAVGPLSSIALLNREHLEVQSTEAQILANIRQIRRQPPGRADPVSMICGNPDALLMPYTNWTRADLFHAADFSAAVQKMGESDPARINPPGTIVYHHAAAMRQGLAARNFIMILGKDHNGNYWITGRLVPLAWNKIEQEMKNL